MAELLIQQGITVPCAPCAPAAPDELSADGGLPEEGLPEAQPLEIALDDGSGDLDLSGLPGAPGAPAAPVVPSSDPLPEARPAAVDLGLVDPAPPGVGLEDDGTVIVA